MLYCNFYLAPCIIINFKYIAKYIALDGKFNGKTL